MTVSTLRNLTPEAVDDLQEILEYSLKWGSKRAAETRERLIARCQRISEGRGLGHKRSDIPTATPVLFITDRPLIIAYNPGTRMVLRNVDGRRNLSRLFGPQDDET